LLATKQQRQRRFGTVKLTIGIPTYNRANYINVALDSVMPQILALDDVDVLVVDNASADRTADVVRRYQERFAGKITYQKNETNIGFSANVDTVVKASAGEYVLVLSDDDALESGAVKYVLDVLSQYKVAALFLGVESWNRELSAPLLSRSGEQVPRGKVYESGPEYVKGERAFPPGCISGYVVNREAWIKASALDFRETLIAHVFAVLRMMKNSSVYRSYCPNIKFRVGNDTAEKMIYQTPLGIFRARIEPMEGLCLACEGYPSETLRILRRNVMRTIIYHLVVDDNHGVDFKALKARIIVANGRFNVHTLIVSILILFPASFLRICRSAMLIAKKRGWL
jgi:glycosyltransferase involved in cell wall biosynthesis